MRKLYYEFQINRKPILVPDEDVDISTEDIDAEESGRDEGGYMHRVVIRKGVEVYSFSYAKLTGEEYEYMRKLIMESGDDFEVKYRDHMGKVVIKRGYCAKHDRALHNARLKMGGSLFKNMKFNIIEC